MWGLVPEAQPWSALGTGHSTNVPLAPAVTLELTPSRVSGDRVGQCSAAHDHRARLGR